MLTAALRHGAAARVAWEAWVEGLDPKRLEEQLEPDSQWLMPLLYHNLSRHQVAHPVLARCRNVYLHNWYKNNASLHALASWLRAAGPTAPRLMLLKGAAMALRYYDALGARPFESIDVWLPTPAQDAPGPLGAGTEGLTVHEVPFPGGLEIDLLGRAEIVQCMGASCSVMSSADQLVHACSQSDSWDSRTRLVWVADAVHVLRVSPNLDWDVAVALASRLGQARRLATALEYLGRFDVPVPARVGAAISRDRAAGGSDA